jgi:quercetin dioxygenase-like cupin family protein
MSSAAAAAVFSDERRRHVKTECRKTRSSWHALAAGTFGALTMVAASAYAGECPADKRVASGQGQKPGATMSQGVTDKVRASIDLSREKVALQSRQFRLRQLDIKPGGIVAWHSHEERPALIYIVKGTVTEYASNCAVPIVHKPGDVAAETHATSHWWKNTGKETAVLISVDIFHDTAGADRHAM